MTNFSMPFNLQQWIDQHREQLKPPVCNKQIFEQDDFIIMVVGGPNSRSDYHYNETPELFYQLEGDMVLSVINEDYARDPKNSQAPTFNDIAIKAGEIPLAFINSIALSSASRSRSRV